MQGLLAEVDNRYLLFNNNADLPEREQQVDRLLQLVRQVVQQNNGCYFRHRMAREVDNTMTQMVKAELQDRAGGQLPYYIEGDTTTEVVKAEMKELPDCLQDKLKHRHHNHLCEKKKKKRRKWTQRKKRGQAQQRWDAIMRRKELQKMKTSWKSQGKTKNVHKGVVL